MTPTYRTKRHAFTIIELLIVLGVIVILSSMALPNMMSSRKRANEASAVASLRLISSAQETYRNRQNPRGYATLSSLGAAGLLDTSLAGGYKSGYNFTQPADEAPTDSSYVVIATPAAHAGDRHFRLDHTGVIRARDGEPATASSSPVE